MVALLADVRYAENAAPSDYSSQSVSVSTSPTVSLQHRGKEEDGEEGFGVCTVDIGIANTWSALTYTHVNQMSAGMVRME